MTNMTNRTLLPRIIVAAFLLGMTGLSAVQAAAPPAAPEPAKVVDVAKLYQGKWIEIARTPAKLTDGCVAGVTEYFAKGNNRVDLEDSCRDQTPAGKLKSIRASGKIVDPGTNAKLHAVYRFLGFIPVTRDYWVLDHADDYSWFISATADFTNFWVYTRDVHPDPALVQSLVAKGKALGYDVSKLEFPAQP